MKKFLSLMLVVVMLAFASSAMAAVTLTANPSPVNVTAGSEATVTLTAGGIDEHFGPAWSFDLLNNPPDWAILNGSDGTNSTRTLTLRPVTAGNYAVRVRVRGSYKPVVHGPTTVETTSTDIDVNVTESTMTATNTVQTQFLQTLREIVNAVKALGERFFTVQGWNSGSGTLSASSLNDESVLKDIVTARRTEIVAALNALVGVTVPTGAPVMSASNISAATTDLGTGTLAERIAKASAVLKYHTGDDEERAIGTISPFRAAASGLQIVDFPALPEVFWGRNIHLSTNQEIKSADAVYVVNDAVFLNSKGTQVTTVPGRNSDDVTPGVITAVFYVRANTTYSPILSTTVPASEAAAFDAATGTTVIAQVVITETIVRSVYISRTFSPVVPDNAKIAIASAMGIASADLWEFDDNVAEGSSWDVSAAESTYMTANDIDEVAKLPRLKDVVSGLYVASISFDNTPREAQVYSKPTLYPYGVKANGAATDATVYAISNNQAYEVPGSAVYSGMNAYLVVRVGTNGVAVADTDMNAALVTIDRPTIAVKLTNVIGVGSSSGGCSAGSAVLALAVLGAFIAARKK